MQDAFGGIVNIVLIALFLIIIEGILGFAVSYTKAFKMKNAVISAIEEYEASGCFGDSDDTPCRSKIRKEALRIGYAPPSSLNCPQGTNVYGNLFCAVSINTNKTGKQGYVAYRVTTQIDINIPIIRDIMSFNFFQVSGDTRVIQRPSD